jgi:hypothetical protein
VKRVRVTERCVCAVQISSACICNTFHARSTFSTSSSLEVLVCVFHASLKILRARKGRLSRRRSADTRANPYVWGQSPYQHREQELTSARVYIHRIWRRGASFRNTIRCRRLIWLISYKHTSIFRATDFMLKLKNLPSSWCSFALSIATASSRDFLCATG